MISFVLFGEFPGYAGQPDGTEGFFQEAQGFYEAVGGFIPDEGALFGQEFLEIVLLAFAGEEALEGELMEGEAASDEGYDESGGAGQHLYGHLAAEGFLDGQVARVRDAWGAAIRNKSYCPVVGHRLIKKPPHPLMLIEGMERTERLTNLIVLQELLALSGVLTPDDIGFSQAGEGLEGNVFQVADGGRDHPEPPHAGRLLLGFAFCRGAALTALAGASSFRKARRRQNRYSLIYRLIQDKLCFHAGRTMLDQLS